MYVVLNITSRIFEHQRSNTGTLQLLAMEGLIAIIGTMSRRCKSLRPLRRGSRSSHGSKDDSEEESEVLTGTPQEFQQRKHHKQKLAMFQSKSYQIVVTCLCTWCSSARRPAWPRNSKIVRLIFSKY